jgi:stringent starvation protein B
MQMTSSRPYLIRAMYQWITDNGMTPHLLVDASVEGVQVPAEHVQNGKIILNIAPMAISALVLGDTDVTFSARFSGKSRGLYVPIEAVLAIYAKENGQGMMFSEDDGAVSSDDDSDPDPGPDSGPGSKPGKAKRPSLRVVK